MCEYMFVYVCGCICMFVSVCDSVYVYEYICVGICVTMCEYMSVLCVCVWICVCAPVYECVMCVCEYECAHVYVCICVYAWVYMSECVLMGTCIWKPEVNPGCLLPPYLSRWALTYWVDLLAGHLWGFACLWLPAVGFRHTWPHLAFHMLACWDLSCLHSWHLTDGATHQSHNASS